MACVTRQVHNLCELWAAILAVLAGGGLCENKQNKVHTMNVVANPRSPNIAGCLPPRHAHALSGAMTPAAAEGAAAAEMQVMLPRLAVRPWPA